MALTETIPITKEDIRALDQLRARLMLAFILGEITEFNQRWSSAREAMENAVASTDSALERLEFVLGDSDQGLNYRNSLERLVAPLGVPNLTNALLVLDLKRWGLDQLPEDFVLAEGLGQDMLEAEGLRIFTDLGPAELAMETPRQITSRLKQKIAPLTKHAQRYNLWMRVELWVENVVNGRTYQQIAARLQSDEDRVAVGDSPYYWVRRQIRSVSRLLGVRRNGRPQKGGVLERFKVTTE